MQYSVGFQRRFWIKITKSDGCWLWAGHRFKNGYGCIRTDGSDPRRQLLTHRVAYELTYGSIPDGLVVCHHCDNPPCVRPDHLFISTQRGNVADCVSKGRAGDHTPITPAHGESHYRAILTDKQVVEIRGLYVPGVVGYIKLAHLYGVHPQTIKKIVKGTRRVLVGTP